MCGGRDPFHRISVTDIEAANKRKDSSDGGAEMIHKILTWCGGYVIVRLPGDQAERFINICRTKGIFWWKVRWQRQGQYVYGCMKRTDYYKLRPVVQKTGVFPVVKERIGGYFWLRRGMARASFWCGILSMLCILFLLAGRIWGIEVSGQSYHTKDSILRYLESEDVYGGMAGKDVVCSEIEAKLRKKYQDIGWASVEKSGSKLYVRLDEVLLQKKKHKKLPASLVAENSGTVLSIVTKTGTAKVRAGDQVKKGQKLISEKVKIVGDNEEVVAKKHVRAAGTVVLQSVYHYQDSLKKQYQKRKITGKSRTIYQINIKNHDLFLYNPLKSLESYEKYDIIREGGQVCPFLSCRFPVFVWKKTFREIQQEKSRYSQEEAAKLLTGRFDYYRQQMTEKGCYDLEGELVIREQGDCFVGEADIVYSKKQKKYQQF